MIDGSLLGSIVPSDVAVGLQVSKSDNNVTLQTIGTGADTTK
jgi:hypothetical protein